MFIRSRVSFLLIALAFAAAFPVMSAAGQNGCAVTKAPQHPFVPPPPFDQDAGSDGSFVLGTPGLWARVTTHWILYRTGNKLPYHSEIYSQNKQDHPPLAVVARPLDALEPLVWSEGVTGAWPVGTRREDSGGGAMITSLPILTAGCWEISAHYTPAQGEIQTLTYTVWVEPK